MAQQASIANLSDAERFVVIEHVIEYISDIRTLVSLTLVSRQARCAVYRSNGLRKLTCSCDVFDSCVELNGTVIRGEKPEDKLKNGLRWLWTIGKRLKTIYLFAVYGASICMYEIVLPLVNNLNATEKRRIESIQLSDIRCEYALGLVRENRNTLRSLLVEFYDISLVPSLQLSMRRYSFPELPESQSFWSVIQHCDRLEVLDLCLLGSDPIPTELWNVLCGTPLKHLSLRGVFTHCRQKLIEVLSCDNLRRNLESLTTDCYNPFCDLLSGRLAGEVISPRLSAAFVNVKKLHFNFVAFCANQDTINWVAFWAIFPAVNNIKDNHSSWQIWKSLLAILSQNVISLCKTYLDTSENRSHDLKIELPVGDAQELRAAIVTAATLSDDQAWCVSHGVHIESETRDEKVERVTLRNDMSTLVFDLKWPTE